MASNLYMIAIASQTKQKESDTKLWNAPDVSWSTLLEKKSLKIRWKLLWRGVAMAWFMRDLKICQNFPNWVIIQCYTANIQDRYVVVKISLHIESRPIKQLFLRGFECGKKFEYNVEHSIRIKIWLSAIEPFIEIIDQFFCLLLSFFRSHLSVSRFNDTSLIKTERIPPFWIRRFNGKI